MRLPFQSATCGAALGGKLLQLPADLQSNILKLVTDKKARVVAAREPSSELDSVKDAFGRRIWILAARMTNQLGKERMVTA
jgi:hypothetical protein